MLNAGTQRSERSEAKKKKKGSWRLTLRLVCFCSKSTLALFPGTSDLWGGFPSERERGRERVKWERQNASQCKLELYVIPNKIRHDIRIFDQQHIHRASPMMSDSTPDPDLIASKLQKFAPGETSSHALCVSAGYDEEVRCWAHVHKGTLNNIQWDREWFLHQLDLNSNSIHFNFQLKQDARKIPERQCIINFFFSVLWSRDLQ